MNIPALVMVAFAFGVIVGAVAGVWMKTRDEMNRVEPENPVEIDVDVKTWGFPVRLREEGE